MVLELYAIVFFMLFPVNRTLKWRISKMSCERYLSGTSGFLQIGINCKQPLTASKKILFVIPFI